MNKPGSYEDLFHSDNTDWNIAVKVQRKTKAASPGKRALMSLLLRLRRNKDASPLTNEEAR